MAATTLRSETPPAPPTPATLVLLRAGVALRLVGVLAVVVAAILVRNQVTRPRLLFLTIAATVSYATLSAVLLRWRPSRLLSPVFVLVELVLGGAVLAADGWVLLSDRTFDPPALGVVWPLAGVLAAGLAFGPWLGGIAGAAVITARLFGATAPDPRPGFLTGFSLWNIDQPRFLPIISLIGLYSILGAGAGYLARLQRRAEVQIESARAHEAVAATLHDGVLQTLAIFQRRSADPELAHLARQTDLDLRAFLSDEDARRTAGDLAAVITGVSREHETRFGQTVQVIVDDPPRCDDDVRAALEGACREALNNVGKHADATTVTVYVGADLDDPDRAMVTVNDDGNGFDTALVGAGRGIDGSIRRRLDDIGGHVKIRSGAQRGTEVQLWGP